MLACVKGRGGEEASLYCKLCSWSHAQVMKRFTQRTRGVPLLVPYESMPDALPCHMSRVPGGVRLLARQGAVLQRGPGRGPGQQVGGAGGVCVVRHLCGEMMCDTHDTDNVWTWAWTWTTGWEDGWCVRTKCLRHVLV